MNKDAWPQGPWTDEPDEEIFKHAGLLCRIIRHGRSGHLCGYVRVPEGHPLHGKGYSDVVPDSLRDSAQAALQSPLGKRGILTAFFCEPDAPRIDILFDVHGSLTFSGELDGLDGHWFGFDCAHAGDLQPDSPYSFDYDAVYRDIEYVRAECRSLSEQLAALAASWRQCPFLVPQLPDRLRRAVAHRMACMEHSAMTQMTSTTTMIRRLSGLLDTRDLSEWEQQFVESLVEKLDAGRVTSLTARQVEALERLHRRHFA